MVTEVRLRLTLLFATLTPTTKGGTAGVSDAFRGLCFGAEA